MTRPRTIALVFSLIVSGLLAACNNWVTDDLLLRSTGDHRPVSDGRYRVNEHFDLRLRYLGDAWYRVTCITDGEPDDCGFALLEPLEAGKYAVGVVDDEDCRIRAGGCATTYYVVAPTGQDRFRFLSPFCENDIGTDDAETIVALRYGARRDPADNDSDCVFSGREDLLAALRAVPLDDNNSVIVARVGS